MHPALTSGVAWCGLCRAVHAEIGQDWRYGHCLRVGRLAARLARRHGVDPRRARLAGLLHDVARLRRPDELLAECERRGLQFDDFERAHPIVLHAPLGAELAREQFGIDDPAIASAVARHTVGALEMEPLDAVLFIADALEPARIFPEREELLQLAFADLERGLLAVYSSTKTYLEARGLQTAPPIEAALRRAARQSLDI